MFANPIDGGVPATGMTYLWKRTGETFDALTLGPSVDASTGHQCGYNDIDVPCWHGFIRNGQIE